ncbi:MAG: Uxx-star family glutaredoxin-like (seleno)protein [Desulfobacterales bacterium]|jgi:glutaredoxin
MGNSENGQRSGPVTILGRDGCPFTRAARESYAAQGRRVDYHSVRADPEAKKKMLAAAGGAARVPVIIDGDSVVVGWQGKW